MLLSETEHTDLRKSIINKSEKLELEVKQHQEETDLLIATAKRWYIISASNTYKFYWDLFVILLAIYNAIALPLQISFPAVESIYAENNSLKYFETSVDCFFALDIIIHFLTAYIDTTDGETIRSPKKIAQYYMKGGFFPDLISTLPLILKPLISSNTEEGSSTAN